MLRLLTAGESHGPALTIVVEGLPAGVPVDRAAVDAAAVQVRSHVVRIGAAVLPGGTPVPWEALDRIEDSPVRCADAGVAQAMIGEIDKAKRAGDTVGGVFEVVVRGLPPGLGSFGQWDRRLDGRLAQALMSIPAVKAVALGAGFEGGEPVGWGFHDGVFYDE